MRSCHLCLNKILGCSLIVFVLLMIDCYSTKWLDPTGRVDVEAREVGQKKAVKIVQMPTVKNPYCIFQIGNVPIYQKIYKDEYRVEKKSDSSVPLTMGIISVLLFSSHYDSSRKIDGLGIALLSSITVSLFWGYLSFLSQPSIVTDYKPRPPVTEPEWQYFKPLAREKVRLAIQLSKKKNKKWNTYTDEKGAITIDVLEFLADLDPYQDAPITIHLSEPDELIEKFLLSSKFINDLKAYYGVPKLTATMKFDDASAFIPNSIIDGGETCYLQIELANTGKGTAQEVSLQIHSEYPGLSVTSAVDVGDLPSGQVWRRALPVTASTDIRTGEAAFTLVARERRGYDAPVVSLEVDVEYLKKPMFQLSGIFINDSRSGLAAGNGNGKIERNETIEAIIAIKNIGEGVAVHTRLRLQEATSGVQLRQKQDYLGNIEPEKECSGKLVF